MDYDLRKYVTSGTRIGGYRVDQYLGAGEEGIVYQVREISTGVPRALKLFHQDSLCLKYLGHLARRYDALAASGATIRYCHFGHTYFERANRYAFFFVFELVKGETIFEFASTMEGSTQERFNMASQLIIRVAEQIGNIHRLGFGAGDFEYGKNIIVQEGTGLPVFCDFDSGTSQSPNWNLENDFQELHALMRLVFKRARISRHAKILDQAFRGILSSRIRRDSMSRFAKQLNRAIQT
ncbi:MAG: hypothetical protein OEV87_10580 [Phycisphaerae bacterium]|nr:hypothetical protein [Phycisphaerae bacterium]